MLRLPCGHEVDRITLNSNPKISVGIRGGKKIQTRGINSAVLTSHCRGLGDILHASPPLPYSCSNPCTLPKEPIRAQRRTPKLLARGSKCNNPLRPCTGHGWSSQGTSSVEGLVRPKCAHRCSSRTQVRKDFRRSWVRGSRLPSSRKSEL